MSTAIETDQPMHDDTASHLMALRKQALSAVVELTDEEQKHLLNWVRKNVSNKKAAFERNCIA